MLGPVHSVPWGGGGSAYVIIFDARDNHTSRYSLPRTNYEQSTHFSFICAASRSSCPYASFSNRLLPAPSYFSFSLLHRHRFFFVSFAACGLPRKDCECQKTCRQEAARKASLPNLATDSTLLKAFSNARPNRMQRLARLGLVVDRIVWCASRFEAFACAP